MIAVIHSSNRFMRLVASILVVTMSSFPVHVSAKERDLSKLGKDAQHFGQELSNSFKSNSGSVKDGVLSAPSMKNGKFQMNGATTINVNELFPGTSTSNTQPDSYYFAGGQQPDPKKLQGVYDSDNGMNSSGKQSKSHLWADANSATPSLSGAAYKILLEATNRSRPDFSNDPMLNLSKKTYQDIDLISDGFGDCQTKDTIKDSSFNAHVTNYERCERLIKPKGDCELTHNIPITSSVENVFIAADGRTWLTVRFNLRTGSWSTIAPTDGEQSTARIPRIDYNAICGDSVASKTDLVGSWDWTSHGLPGKPDSTVNYRVKQMPTCENNLVGIVQIEDTKHTDDLDFSLGGKFSFRLISMGEDDWSPEQCLSDAKSLEDGFCTGAANVTLGASDDSSCTTVNGVQICPGDALYNALKPSPSKAIPRLAQKLHVSNLQCDFNVGQMDCWKDPKGNTQCPMNNGEKLSSCEELEKNPKCGFISSECVDGATGDTGACHVFTDTYDCGDDVNVPTYDKETQYDCSGPIRCMGEDCIDANQTQSKDFARAAAMLNAAQMMTQDMSCTEGATGDGGDGNIDRGCSIFAGNAGECKVAVGGVSDCCEKPSNVSMVDYLTLILAVPKLDSAVMAIDSESSFSAVKGAYQTLRQPVMDSWSTVTKPFTSYIENIEGTVETITKPISQFTDELVAKLEEKASQVMTEVFGSVAESAGVGGEAVAGQALDTAKDNITTAYESVTNVLGPVMTAYTVYVVAITLINIIWKCEEDELSLNVKRALKSCRYIGSYCKTKALGQCVEKREAYCCFSSPLSRIIQEQIRPQLGQSFGTAKNPQCAGILLEDVNKIDWSKIDLDEWVGIMQQNGKLPSPDSINLDSVTGSGSIFNTTGDRANAEQRTMDRFDGIDVDKKRREAANIMKIDRKGEQ